MPLTASLVFDRKSIVVVEVEEPVTKPEEELSQSSSSSR
jgi:hypothetical protein